MKDSERVIVNSYGEIENTLYTNDTIKIIRGSTKDYLNSTIEINKDEDFVKVYTKAMFGISRSLSGTESTFVNYLLQYIQYQTGILTLSNGRTLSRSHMAQETELDVKTVDKILNNLIKKQILGKHKTGRTVCFLVNPYIFMKGNRVNKTLVKLFENTRWAKGDKL